MILLITPSAKVQENANALEEAVSEPLQIAASLRQAVGLLRSEEYSAVLVDLSPDRVRSRRKRPGPAAPGKRHSGLH